MKNEIEKFYDKFFNYLYDYSKSNIEKIENKLDTDYKNQIYSIINKQADKINDLNDKFSSHINKSNDLHKKLKNDYDKMINDMKTQNSHEIDNLRYFCEGLINCKFNDLKNYIDDCLKQ